MFSRGGLPRPTDGELSILRVIWQHGPCTVRTIRDVLNADRSTQYTTVLKLLQIMTTKGLVLRDGVGRSHVYRAALSESQTQRQLLRDLLDRAFGGSADMLVMQALETARASDSDLTAIDDLIARARDQRDGK